MSNVLFTFSLFCCHYFNKIQVHKIRSFTVSYAEDIIKFIAKKVVGTMDVCKAYSKIDKNKVVSNK